MNQLLNDRSPSASTSLRVAATRCTLAAFAFSIFTLICTAAETPVVSPSDAWLIHKGNSAPVANWQTVPDAQLTNWVTAPGGFGYSTDSSAETLPCKTLLTDMEDAYTTLYIRRTFEAPPVNVSPDAHLFLKMDFDDGFIAWLDGRYITNMYSPGTTAEPSNTAVATSSHESSLGNSSPRPAVVLDLGPASSALSPGQHVLAVMGLNNSIGSSDFVLVPSLYVATVPTNTLSGSLATNTTFRAAKSPYIISGNLTVLSNVTLTIEAGVEVQFDSDASLTVANGGQLLANGTAEAPVAFTRPSSQSPLWRNIVIQGGTNSPETRITHAWFEGNSTSPCIHVDGGSVYLTHLEFNTRNCRYIDIDNSSFILSHCYFPGTIGDHEPIHGVGGIRPGGHGIIQNCFFGPISGYNDTIDFTGCNRPGPIIQVINNVFAGTGDDNLDLDSSDAWVQGNIFLHAHKNGSPDTSSPVSGGNDNGQNGDATIIGNFFYDFDQAVMAKQGNFYTLLNNTMVRQSHEGGTDTTGALLCVQDNNMTEGKGMYLERNIVVDIENLTRNVANAVITFTNNFLPLQWSGAGGGNLNSDPMLAHIPDLQATMFTNWASAQVMKQWLSLRANSPARHSVNGSIDAGADIPFGVLLTGAPAHATTSREITVWPGPCVTAPIPASDWPEGAGYTHYKWQLDDSDWSLEISARLPILATNLTPGIHTLRVIGKNDAGFYQDDPRFEENATVTAHSWVILAQVPMLSISIAEQGAHLRFPITSSAQYEVQFCEALSPPSSWQTLTNIPPQQVAGEMTVTDSSPRTAAKFYRLVVH